MYNRNVGFAREGRKKLEERWEKKEERSQEIEIGGIKDLR